MTSFFRPRSSNKYIRMRGVQGRYTGPVPDHICPETGEEVSYYHCASECPKYRVHTKGDVPRCKYEYEELLESGYYARTEDEWLEHLQVADPDTYQRLIEEKRERERVLAEMEAERSDVTMQAEGEEQGQQRDTEKEGETESETQEEQEKPRDEGEEDDDDKNEDDEPDGWW